MSIYKQFGIWKLVPLLAGWLLLLCKSKYFFPSLRVESFKRFPLCLYVRLCTDSGIFTVSGGATCMNSYIKFWSGMLNKFFFLNALLKIYFFPVHSNVKQACFNLLLLCSFIQAIKFSDSHALFLAVTL